MEAVSLMLNDGVDDALWTIYEVINNNNNNLHRHVPKHII